MAPLLSAMCTRRLDQRERIPKPAPFNSERHKKRPGAKGFNAIRA